jgi:hypothetical protein
MVFLVWKNLRFASIEVSLELPALPDASRGRDSVETGWAGEVVIKKS